MTIHPRNTPRFARSTAILLVAIGVSSIHAQTVAAVSNLDRKSLTGTWYEIAKLPNKREKHCAADAIELIALGDKTTQLQLVDACTDIKAYKDSWNFTASHKGASGALKVRTIYPLSRKYWVLATGPIDPVATPASAGYAWTLIGSPNHKTLWIFARTATLSTEELVQIKAKAGTMGFDATKLVMVPQTRK